MSPLTVLPEAVLRDYFRAKDESRPHLLDRVFDEEVVLEVRNGSSTITFPAITQGRGAGGRVLVGDFTRTYENIYSFYMSRPGHALASFGCGWLVVMTERGSGDVRVGHGRYDWEFASTPPCLVKRLVITISAMSVFAPHTAELALAWVRTLSYPWSSRMEVLRSPPDIPGLAPLLQGVDGAASVA